MNMSTNKASQKATIDRKTKTYIIIGAVVLLQLVLSIILGKYLFKKNFSDSKKNVENDITGWAYETTYDATEKAYHVSNEATLNWGTLREEAKLEVLEAYSTHYYVVNKADKNALDMWYAIPGQGVFTVNMKMSEVITDLNRNYVLIRVPLPVLSYDRLDKQNIAQYRLEDSGIFSSMTSSTKDGVDLADEMLNQSQQWIRDNISSDAEYLKYAKDNAVRIIQSLVKNLNPDIPDLVVEVEFM